MKKDNCRTDFGADDLDQGVLEAQRLEKERLDRLEKSKPVRYPTSADRAKKCCFISAK